MVNLKMGRHNRITKERYSQIRVAMQEGMSKHEIMNRYKIKDSTFRKIRRADTYYAYQLTTKRLPRPGRMPTVICEVAGVPYKDININKRPAKKQDDKNSQTAYSYDATTNVVKIVTAGWVVVIVAVIVAAVAMQFIN